MIIPIDKTNIDQAARIHSESWRESHRLFCSEEFVSLHTPEHQREYLQKKLDAGSALFMLVDKEPVGIVSVNGSMIEDLYVLPDKQRKGYGSALLEFAISKCDGTPTLWILENNSAAEEFYLAAGFKRSGRLDASRRIAEVELVLL